CERDPYPFWLKGWLKLRAGESGAGACARLSHWAVHPPALPAAPHAAGACALSLGRRRLPASGASAAGGTRWARLCAHCASVSLRSLARCVGSRRYGGLPWPIANLHSRPQRAYCIGSAPWRCTGYPIAPASGLPTAAPTETATEGTATMAAVSATLAAPVTDSRPADSGAERGGDAGADSAGLGGHAATSGYACGGGQPGLAAPMRPRTGSGDLASNPGPLLELPLFPSLDEVKIEQEQEEPGQDEAEQHEDEEEPEQVMCAQAWLTCYGEQGFATLPFFPEVDSNDAYHGDVIMIKVHAVSTWKHVECIAIRLALRLQTAENGIRVATISAGGMQSMSIDRDSKVLTVMEVLGSDDQVLVLPKCCEHQRGKVEIVRCW
ncbi:unnamed protein product, partial [Prorocentrum cordatum]